MRRYILDNVADVARGLPRRRAAARRRARAVDASELHLLEEMAIEVAALSAHQRRPLTLIAESDLNDPLLVTPARGAAATVSTPSGATTSTTPCTSR